VETGQRQASTGKPILAIQINLNNYGGNFNNLAMTMANNRIIIIFETTSWKEDVLLGRVYRGRRKAPHSAMTPEISI